jgi:hypothetical protein
MHKSNGYWQDLKLSNPSQSEAQGLARTMSRTCVGDVLSSVMLLDASHPCPPSSSSAECSPTSTATTDTGRLPPHDPLAVQ